MPGYSPTHMAAVRHLVVVASAEPSTTDALADFLRDAFTVRTAYSTDEVLDRLDPDVDVVLVDPDLPGRGVDAVREALADRDLNCQVGLLTADSRDCAGAGAGAVVSPAEPGPEVRERVERLATRAHYRKTLEEYYELAQTSARQGQGEDLETERERLRDRLDRLQRRLDEVAEPLDTATLFRTALDTDPEE